MRKEFKLFILLFVWMIGFGSAESTAQSIIQHVNGIQRAEANQVWLTHEHILVDFIGADSIQSGRWNHAVVMKEMLPFLEELNEFNVSYFVDATPNYLGRDVRLLQKLANQTGLRIITNTGLYGVRNNKFIPGYALDMTAEKLAEMWTREFEVGIDGTAIKPGFIKIGVDNADPLSEMHQKLVKAAALTHLKTGLTIASHTGKAKGMWLQLAILKEAGVSPEAFIWVHAQNETDNGNYLKAAKLGCWISLDGVGWELEKYIAKILFAKENGILDKILISHDAGWYDPGKEIQNIKAFTNIFRKLYPELKSRGFTEEEFKLLVSVNPAKAFGISVRSSR